MVSIGPIPFVVKVKAESLVLPFTQTQNGSRFPFLNHRPKRSIFDLSLHRSWFSMRFKPLRAAGKDSDGADDALDATVEKSKRVLALQRNLLQQIAERRKRITDIKDSILDPDVEKASSSYEDQDMTTEGEVIEQKNGSSVSGGHVHEVIDKEVAEAESLASSSVVDDRIEHGLDLIPESAVSDENFTRLTEDTASEKVLSKKLPPLESSFSFDEQSVGMADGAYLVAGDEGEVPPPLAGPNVMNVILVAAECAPWSKTGGLGDVAGSLPKALARRGHRVMVLAPRYGDYAEPQNSGVIRRYKVDGQDMEVKYYQAFIDGVDFVFIDSPVFRHIENNIYGGNRVDILKRMALFCKAAIELGGRGGRDRREGDACKHPDCLAGWSRVVPGL